jgi:hypothetical protein
MSTHIYIKKYVLIILIVLLALALSGCSIFDGIIGGDEGDTPGSGLPPGSNEPGGDLASPNEPQTTLALPDSADTYENSLPTRPVRFRNLGTIGYTVSAWSYIPMDASELSTPSPASTTAFPAGGASSALSLPLGTYTWCYAWELGDTNGDGLMEYAHAIDSRPVVLDENDSDDVDLSEIVDLSAPANSSVSSGLCGEVANIEVSPEPAALTSAPTPPPGEMIEAKGIWTGYPDACPFPENEIHWQFNSEGGPITGDAKQYSACDGFMQYLDVEFKGTYDGSQNFSGEVWVESHYTCDEDPCYPPFDYPAAWNASMTGDTITGWVDGLGGFSLTVINSP